MIYVLMNCNLACSLPILNGKAFTCDITQTIFDQNEYQMEK